jgi:hypothetical protein
MTKKAKTFRLSEQAIKHLNEIVVQTGSNDTAIVEMALAHFSQFMRGGMKQNSVNTNTLPTGKKIKRRRRR